MARDLTLDRKDVVQIAVETVAPELVAVARIHQLRRHAHTGAGAPDASVERRAYAEPVTEAGECPARDDR
jgi:hypothetical protein